MKVIPKFQHPADALPKIINRQMDKITERTHPDGTISYLWKNPETNEEFPLTDLGNGQYSLDRGNGVTSFFNPKQAEQINNEKKKGVDLAPLFANLMTGGYASIAQNASEDIKNRHYLSGGMKMISPLIVPAFARAPMKMAKGIIGAELAGNASDYMWARTMGKGKTFSTDLSNATGGRISEEEGRMLNPATWWGFKMGMDSHRWRPNGYVGMNGAPNSSATIEDPIIYKTTRSGLPYFKSDLEALRSLKPTEHMYNGQIKRVYKLDGKQAMTEQEYNALIDKFEPKRKLTSKEKELAKQAPDIIKRLKKKGIDFTEDSWFQGRGELGSNKPDAVTQLDLDIYRSHIPEMESLAESLQASGDLVEKSPNNWFGRIDGELKKVDPAEYIAYRSKAFHDNGWYWDGVNYKRAMTNEQFNDILKDGDIGKTTWTTDDNEQANTFLSEPPRNKLIQTIVGNVPKKLWKFRPSKFAKERRELLNGVEYSPNVSYRGTTGNYLLFGHDVPVKSLRGNNLDYSKQYKGIYKMLIPTIIGGTYIGSLDNNQ